MISQLMEIFLEVRERTLETTCEKSEVIEVAETSSQDRKSQHTVEQDSVEVVKNVPREGILN